MPRMGQRILQTRQAPASRLSKEGGGLLYGKATENCSQEFEFMNSNENLKWASLTNISLKKEDERKITNAMIQREIYGSKESGIFSESSNQEYSSPDCLRSRFDRHHDSRRSKRKKSFRSQSQPVMFSEKNYEANFSKKGFLWQQKDSIFSRWKERYVVLNNDAVSTFENQDMKSAIHKIPISNIVSVSLVERKGQQILMLESKEGTFFYRSYEGVQAWYDLILHKIRRGKDQKIGSDNTPQNKDQNNAAVPKVRDLEASGKFGGRKSKKDKFFRKRKEKDNCDKKEGETINNYYFV